MGRVQVGFAVALSVQLFSAAAAAQEASVEILDVSRGLERWSPSVRRSRVGGGAAEV